MSKWTYFDSDMNVNRGRGVSLIGLFILAIIFFVIGFWFRIFNIFGIVLLVIIFIVFLWRLVFRPPKDIRSGERVSLLGLIIVGIIFLLIGYWIEIFYTLGIIILIIAFIVFLWRLALFLS